MSENNNEEDQFCLQQIYVASNEQSPSKPTESLEQRFFCTKFTIFQYFQYSRKLLPTISRGEPPISKPSFGKYQQYQFCRSTQPSSFWRFFLNENAFQITGSTSTKKMFQKIDTILYQKKGLIVFQIHISLLVYLYQCVFQFIFHI